MKWLGENRLAQAGALLLLVTVLIAILGPLFISASPLKIDLESFDASRVKVVTENNVVYLMGLVTPAEASAAVEKARWVDGVAKVVKVFEYI